jgi:enolase
MNKQYQRIAGFLHSDHVIANHILVSFHVAFISSLLNIPAQLYGPHVLRFVFTSYETVISIIFWLFTFHTGIAIHEMGHYLKAVRNDALDESLLPQAKKHMSKGFLSRIFWYIGMFFAIPYGKFRGIKKEGLTYYPEAPFNLSVAAAGPKVSGRLAMIALPVAIILLVTGASGHYDLFIYIGRLALGMGCVGLIDFFLADPGKYREYRKREAEAAAKSSAITQDKDSWIDQMKKIKEKMRSQRMQEITLPDGDRLRAPWQFRNCGMGGRHTEKEYPESNISFQELMFIPLCARDYEEAQMITITLQTRLKEIIEKEEGARVMGIGLEGGLAPYVEKTPEDTIPEERLYRLAVQAIKDSGYRPGEDIVIAFDQAASELSLAYRQEFKKEKSIGMYYFWRSAEKGTMSREQLVDLYKKTLVSIPAVSFEDSFAEDDEIGWQLLMKDIGDKVFIIGDDLITTKDSTIESCIDKKMINTALIKANQIGTLSETMIAVLVALGKGLDVVISHRSKSPNDDMEAQIALAVNALGLKTGGGANTERLFKYGAVTKIMKAMKKALDQKYESGSSAQIALFLKSLQITDIIAYEEPTNAGIPTVGVEVHAGIAKNRDYEKILRFTGSTPLGTSAGTDEAIHLVDSIIEKSPVVDRHQDFFTRGIEKTYIFKKDIKKRAIEKANDPELSALWEKNQRYNGKGCQNAVKNVADIIAPEFIGKKCADFKSIVELDRILLKLEKNAAIARGKIPDNAGDDECIQVMQRKINLGMNAILSLSLAMARMIAHIQGKDLWQLLRQEMKQAIAKVVMDNNGLDFIDDTLNPAQQKKLGKKQDISWQKLVECIPFDDLISLLRKVSIELRKKDIKLYKVLRQHLDVYKV